MSDVITDTTRCTKEAIHRFRESIRQEVIGSFTVKELVDELCKREGIREHFITPYDIHTIAFPNLRHINKDGIVRILEVH